MIETMTIHKALSELKILGDRIEDATNETQFVGSVKKCFDTINGKKISDIEADMKSSHQKITDLIKRQEAIKKAVTKSNAETVIKIGNVEMTIAEAIWMKQQGLDSKKQLLNKLSCNYNSAISRINSENEALTNKAEVYIQNVYGTKDKVDSAELIKARDEYIKNNTLRLVEGFDVKKEIERLNNEISEFQSEVDAAISVSNAITVIEVTY